MNEEPEISELDEFKIRLWQYLERIKSDCQEGIEENKDSDGPNKNEYYRGNLDLIEALKCKFDLTLFVEWK